MENKVKKEIAILVLILVLIIVLIVAIMAIVKNADEIRMSPIDYALNKTSLESCTCVDDLGNTYVFGEAMVIQNWTS